MITKFNKYDKVFESLPRQSTVDQLHRIRDEIKKSQVVKVGPDESSMGGDIGDRVMQDLKKHQMNNLFFWDNPLDRHIDSYETFVQDDSRDSLGYTKEGDPKKHKGTDYVKEGKFSFEEWKKKHKWIQKKEVEEEEEKVVDPELDPYGEEIWDDNRTKYDWNEIRQQRYYKK